MLAVIDVYTLLFENVTNNVLKVEYSWQYFIWIWQIYLNYLISGMKFYPILIIYMQIEGQHTQNYK